MTDNPQTQRTGLQPVRAFLPPWAQRLLVVLERYPRLLQHMPSSTPTAPRPDMAWEFIHTHSSEGDSGMTSPPKLRVHPGGRSQCINALHTALYQGLMANDQALIDHALALDRRLAQRAALRDLSARIGNPAQATPQD